MDPSTHYALLVAINRYPGLSDLHGPENDADALAAWLKGPGGVPADHVEVIKSSDFAAAKDPYDANPTDTNVKKALNAWLKDAQNRWCDRVGERLYLFFAGHGFTAGSLTDPALFTAQAQLDDRTHIAAYRYAAKIANAGFFDEIVLLMDCCQDVLKASAVFEPSWSPPDRSASGRVRQMIAFGAPRGHKAFEDAPPDGAAPPAVPAAPVHGFFSSVFLEALRSAPADAQGRVSARAVEGRFVELWAQGFLQKVGYEPPFTAPRDMVLYVRPAAAPPVVAAPPPAGASPPAPAQGPGAGPDPVPIQVPPAAAPAIPAAPATRDVRIELPELGAQFNVLDARNRVVARSTRSMRLTLPPGLYRAQVHMGGALQERPFVVEPRAVSRSSLGFGAAAADATREVALPALDFASPSPAPWSSSHHEYQMGPCQALLDRARQIGQAGDPHAALLFVFARDSAHRPLHGPWRMAAPLRRALRLRRLGVDGAQAPLATGIEADDGGAWCSITQELPPGTWLLGARRRVRERWVWDEVVLECAPGWRTEVYLDCLDDAQDGRRYDLDNVAWRAVPRDAGDRMGDTAWRATEQLRVALAQPGGDEHEPLPIVDPDALGPVATLFAAVLQTRQTRPALVTLRAQLAWLRLHWSAHAADLVLLERWCDAHDRAAAAAAPPPATLAADAVPTLAACWSLLADPVVAAQLAPAMQRSVALWRTLGGAQVQMQSPETAAPPAPDGGAPMPLRPDGRPDLARLAAALGRPDPLASPLLQNLRLALLDARDEADPAALNRAAEAVARSAGLDAAMLHEALQQLWANAPARRSRAAAAGAG